MTVQRKKGKQINFRLADGLGDRFEDYCRRRSISQTQFLENSIRLVLGERLTIPHDALAPGDSFASTSPDKFKINSLASTADIKITAADVQGLERLVKDIIRGEMAATLGE